MATRPASGTLAPHAAAWWHEVEGDLVPPEAVLAGDVTIRDVSSRNRALLISRERVPGAFVKRGSRVAQEGRVIARLATRVTDPAILPRVLRCDVEEEILVLIAEAGEADLWTLHRRLGRFPSRLGAAAGRALAVLHRLPPDEGDASAPPGVATLHRPRPVDLADMTPALARLIATVQSAPALVAGLDELREGWAPTALLHGDVKWPNMLARDPPDPGQEVVRLVDWEGAAGGDPAWDLGSALAAYVSAWIGAVPPPPDTVRSPDPAALAAGAEHPIEDMQPAMAALWDAYLAARPVPVEGLPTLRRSTALCCGAALVRTALNEAAVRASLTPRAMLHLQVAANVMADPEVAAHRLLALSHAA